MPMISAVRIANKPQGRGFTLIEIIMVLAIAALVIGGAMGLMAYSSDERSLRKTSGKIEYMAKQARTMSILHQTPYALEFSEKGIQLMPLAQTGMGGKEAMSSRKQESTPDPAASSEDRHTDLTNGMTLSMRRWNSSEWLTTSKNVQYWRFDPDGICEPVSIRLSLGNSWAEDTYHPLTATIRDSQLEVR